MLRRCFLPALATLCVLSCTVAEPETTAPALDSDDDKVLYTLGLAMARQIAQFDFDEAELAVIERGLADGALGRDPAVDWQTWGPEIDPFLRDRLAAAGERHAAEGAAFLEKMKAEPGATVLDSGVIVFTEQEGVGEHPGPTAKVKVNYAGTFPNGEEFDASEPGQPVSFTLNGVVRCFSEGIQEMKVGGKARLVCPPETAYGEGGNPPRVPPNATLVFEVELMGFEEPEANPDAPGAMP
jgi:FKBP-type peptidyl-prolyl cis-trans isomerase FkpA